MGHRRRRRRVVRRRLVSVVAPLVRGRSHEPDRAVVLLVVQDGTMIAWLAFVARRKGLGSRSRRTSASGSSREDGGPGDNDARGCCAGSGCSSCGSRPRPAPGGARRGRHARKRCRIAVRARAASRCPLIFLAVGGAGAGRRGAALPRRAAAVAAAQDDAGLGGVRLRRRLRPRPLRRPVGRDADRVPGDPARSGLVSGYQAVRTGDLSRSIMLHIGFNMLSSGAALRVIPVLARCSAGYPPR